MKVNLSAKGKLTAYIGKEVLSIELPENATLNGLLVFINNHWGSDFPNYVWDSKKTKFRGNVFMVSDGKIVKKKDMLLREDQNIEIVLSLIGG